MIKIVITGFDNKIGPGDIVGAFINECGVDSNDIGKIDINSRQAEVELDDKIAAKVVKIMNDNKIGGNSVKVRAKNVDHLLPEDLLRYMENSRRKIEAEKNHFEKEYNYLKKEIDIIKRLRSGVAINGLKARVESWLDSDNLILTLYHQMPGQLLPIGRFKPGDYVEISSASGDKTISGQIFEINKGSVLVAINEDFPEDLEDRNLILDKSYNKEYYNNLLSSVDSIEDFSGASERLRDAFLLDRAQDLNLDREKNSRDFEIDILSDEQKDAVLGAEAAEEFYLIGGPAGSGKTTVISEILLNSLKSRKRVLVLSKLNSTLDRLYNFINRQLSDIKIGRTGLYNKESWFAYDNESLDILLANPLDLDEVKDYGSFDLVIFEDSYLYSEAEFIDPISISEKVIIAGDLYGVKAESLAIDNYKGGGGQLSFFAKKFKSTPDSLKSWLSEEYRYSSEIRDFVSNYIYSDKNIEIKKTETKGKFDLNKYSFTEAHPLINLFDSEMDCIFLDTSNYQDEERKVEGLKDYYNRFEADIIEEAVELLINAGYEADEIGVISPFNYQVIEIKKRLVNYDIKVDSSYNFQGEERDVILISTVRSNQHEYLGRLEDLEELYIGLTRSRERTIIVGNAPTLKSNRIYRRLLDNIDVKQV